MGSNHRVFDGRRIAKKEYASQQALRRKVVAGLTHGHVLQTNGTMFGWGGNAYGQLGAMATGSALTHMVPVAGQHSFVAAAAGMHNTAALKADGSLWAWGQGGTGSIGQHTTAVDRSSPTSVAGAHSFVRLAAGDIMAALKADGSAWAWGRASNGALGQHTVVADRSSPVSVVGGHSFVEIANGLSTTDSFIVARKADGTAWTWGRNFGQLGDNSTASRSSPVSVVGNHSFILVVAGTLHCTALKADGTAWAWGVSEGQIGDNTFVQRSSPVSVFSAVSFRSIFTGPNANHVWGMDDGGYLYAWGAANSSVAMRPLRGGTVVGNAVSFPTLYPPCLVRSPQIACGFNATLFMTRAGDLYAVGLVTTLSSGRISIQDNRQPIAKGTSTSYSMVATGQSFCAGLKADGTIETWGSTTSGALGRVVQPGNTEAYDQSEPYVIARCRALSFTTLGRPSTGGACCAIDGDGKVWSWGRRQFAGNFFDNPPSGNFEVPIRAMTSHRASLVVSSYNGLLILTQQGSVLGIGAGTEIGTNTSITYGSPKVLAGQISFSALATGRRHTVGVNSSNNTAWWWGQQIGNPANPSFYRPQSLVGSHSFSQVAAGDSHALGMKTDGSAWSWGFNLDGELGDNTTTHRTSPVSVVGNHTFTAITAAFDHSVALKADGSVWSWGFNTDITTGGSSAVGDNTNTDRSSPVSVVGAHSFTVIAAAFFASAALKSDGTAWAWGQNSGGTVGDNTNTHRSSPVSVVGAHSFTKIFAGGATTDGAVLAIRSSNGSTWVWGSSTSGLGDNSTEYRSSPVSVVGAHSFDTGTVGPYHFLALKASDGSAWFWGHGGLGDNTTEDRSSPVSVVGAHSFMRVAAGGDFSVALKADGSAWTWGANYVGMLGNNTASLADTSAYRSSPVSVVGGHAFADVSAGLGHVLARKSDGSAWVWGFNNSGQLGDNTNENRSSPVSVMGGHVFSSIKSGFRHSSGLKSDGSIWTWGDDRIGQLGQHTTTAGRSSPISVIGGHNFSLAALGGEHTLAQKSSDGSAWAWGQNAEGPFGGVLGDGTTINRSSPVSVLGGHSFIRIAACPQGTMALKADGSAWAWGINSSGQIGDATLQSRDSPVSVVGGHSFASIFGSKGGIATHNTRFFGLKADGALWGWGSNFRGALGVGDATIQSYIDDNDRSSPTSVHGGFVFSKVTSGSTHTMALTKDGTLWSWGTGGHSGLLLANASTPQVARGGMCFDCSGSDYPLPYIDVIASDHHTFGRLATGVLVGWGQAYVRGVLGDDTSTFNYSEPVLCGGDHKFEQLDGANHVFVGIKYDNTAWGWGSNAFGAIGDNTLTNRSSITAVVGSHSFTQISTGGNATLGSATVGLKSDGSAWAWGSNGYGTLGQHTTTANRSSPVSVVGGHSFTSIAILTSNVMALKTDGSLWAWGRNIDGQLGQHTSVEHRSSPVSVIGEHSFAKLGQGVAPNFCVALKADGSAWSWGQNASAQLGDNSVTSRSSPVSVAGGHSFTDVAASDVVVAAIKAEGSVWCWGSGNGLSNFALGEGNTVAVRSSPVSVIYGPHTSFNYVAAIVDTTGALRTDGTFWGFGSNGNGEIGNNTVTSSSFPESAVGGHSFMQVTGGANHFLALKADGSAWAWGTGAAGQLGQNTVIVSRSSPVSVIGDHSFVSVAAIFGTAGAIGASYGLKPDGSLWAWGIGTAGELGQHTVAVSRSSPVSVVGGFSFVALAHGDGSAMFATDSIGRLWAWGTGGAGALGQGTVVASRSSPVSVIGGHSSFVAVACGTSRTFAVKSDGTCWAWGLDALGNLGVSKLLVDASVARSSPVSVVGAWPMSTIAARGSRVLALRRDGIAMIWGTIQNELATSSFFPRSMMKICR